MLTLDSNLNNVAAVQPFVEQTARDYHISPDTYGNILITLTEAVNNAIRHGNCCEEKKKVRVGLRKKGDKITFRVSDQGNGFDYNNVPDPLAPENVDRVGGRGIFLMRTLSDGVQFKNNGSTIEMNFNL